MLLTSETDEFINYFTGKTMQPDIVLRNPAYTNLHSLSSVVINLVHKYVNSVDTKTRMVYLHYLLGKDFEENSHMLNISEDEVIRCFRTFISKFNWFVLNQFKRGNIDTKQTRHYIRQLQNAKMDDRQVAACFHEEIVTTKVMKHFLRHANII